MRRSSAERSGPNPVSKLRWASTHARRASRKRAPPASVSPQFLEAAVGAARSDRDQPVAFERADVAAEGGAVHDQLGRELVDRHRPAPLQPGEDAVLAGAQPRARQMPIVKLRHIARRLSHREAVAIRQVRLRLRYHARHRRSFHLFYTASGFFTRLLGACARSPMPVSAHSGTGQSGGRLYRIDYIKTS